MTTTIKKFLEDHGFRFVNNGNYWKFYEQEGTDREITVEAIDEVIEIQCKFVGYRDIVDYDQVIQIVESLILRREERERRVRW